MAEIQIAKWYDPHTVLWRGEAADMRAAVIAAVAGGADLHDADLGDADLHGADLRGADLRGADLGGADLHGADLRGADLGGADLHGADLRGADLGGADLGDADLRDANLRGANLGGANLRGADLAPIRDDIWAVLSAAPAEVPALIAALREGRIDGSVYSGACACLVGTIANARGCSIDDLGPLTPNSRRPAETWFLGINPGDTPDTNPQAQLALAWIEDWYQRMQAAFTPTAAA